MSFSPTKNHAPAARHTQPNRLVFFYGERGVYNWPVTIPDALVVAHLAGLAAGFGGAIASDAIFLAAAANRRVTRPEVRFMKLGSRLVWLGLAALFVSGVGLFALAPQRYLADPEFGAKMLAVGVLALNGLAFHRVHVPAISARAAGDERRFSRLRPWMLFSGALSGASWLTALVLGAVDLPAGFGFREIVAAYGATVAVGGAGAILLRRKLAPARDER